MVMRVRHTRRYSGMPQLAGASALSQDRHRATETTNRDGNGKGYRLSGSCELAFEGEDFSIEAQITTGELGRKDQEIFGGDRASRFPIAHRRRDDAGDGRGGGRTAQSVHKFLDRAKHAR